MQYIVFDYIDAMAAVVNHTSFMDLKINGEPVLVWIHFGYTSIHYDV